MTSKERFNQELDHIPVDAPYEVVANLRLEHLLLHRAALVNEQIPYTAINIEELLRKLKEMKPTNLSQALDAEEEIEYLCANGDPEWTLPTLNLALRLRRDHIPPENVDHQY